ncbi:hypothetical protein [Rickettsia sp. MEAM1 (Bemisia tabaci)]|uniref:hypothetical protein n=2 Tax=Rickettsia TaxID=780 RepID=UPI0002EB3C87|nr:hypothetical protein [Rickettsia sp. MEAM1 (Bemisia tabaci)]
MKQSSIKVIFNELKTIFKTSNNIEQKKEVALFDYFEIVRDNLACTFQKIIREYERD